MNTFINNLKDDVEISAERILNTATLRFFQLNFNLIAQHDGEGNITGLPQAPGFTLYSLIFVGGPVNNN